VIAIHQQQVFSVADFKLMTFPSRVKASILLTYTS
jgi:hypothetical protein